MIYQLKRICIIAVIVIFGHGKLVSAQQNFGAVTDGFWDQAGTWVGGTGFPGASDSVWIGTTSQFSGTAAANATVTLSADQQVLNLRLGLDSGTNGILDLGGNHLVVTSLFFGNGTGQLIHADGSLTADFVELDGGNSFLLGVDDVVKSSLVSGGSAMTTTAVGNLVDAVEIFGANTSLTLGADLVLSGDVTLQGTDSQSAVLNIGAHDLVGQGLALGFSKPAFGITAKKAELNRTTASITLSTGISVNGGNQFALKDGDSIPNISVSDSGSHVEFDLATLGVSNLDVRSGASANVKNGNSIVGSVTVWGDDSTIELQSGDIVLTGDLVLQGGNTSTAIFDANGGSLNVENLIMGQSRPAFGVTPKKAELRNAGNVVVRNSLIVRGGSQFVFDSAADSAVSLFVEGAGTSVDLHALTSIENVTIGSASFSTKVEGNITNTLTLNGADSGIDLGADLVLAGDVVVQGSTTQAATLDTNGFTINVRNLSLGISKPASAIVPGVAVVAGGGDINVSNALSVLAGNGVDLSGGVVGESISILGAQSKVSIGTSQVLGSIRISGSTSEVAELDANGNDIAVTFLTLGGEGGLGRLTDHGALSVVDLGIESGSTFEFRAGDSASNVSVSGATSSVTFDAGMAPIVGLSLSGGATANGEMAAGNTTISFSSIADTVNANIAVNGNTILAGNAGTLNGILTIDTGLLTVNSSLSLTGSGAIVITENGSFLNNGMVDLSLVFQGNLNGGAGTSFDNRVFLETATVSGTLDFNDTLVVQTIGESVIAAGALVDVDGLTSILAGSTLVVDASGSIFGVGDLTAFEGAQLRVNGQVTKDVFIEQGAVLSGTGEVTGTITIEGDLDPGNSAGIIKISGALDLTPTTTTDVEIGGTMVGTEYDQILGGDSMASVLTVDGFLKITLIDGFIPDVADEFIIFDNFDFTGEFSNTIQGRVFFDEGSFQITYGDAGFDSSTQIRLSGFYSVPEPGALLMLGLMGLGVLNRRRRYPC